MITLWSFQARAQIRIGIIGGYNYNHLSPNHATSKIFSYSTAAFRGYNSGFVAEMQLAKYWFLRPGIIINGRGTRLKKIKEGWDDTSCRFIELHYIEIPLSIIHYWKAGKKSSAFIGAGFYVARAFRGVEKGLGTSGTGPYYLFNHVDFSSQNRENHGLPTVVNPMDHGFNVIAGMERQSVQLLINYGQGFQRVFPKSLVFEEKFTTRVLSFSAAYFFKTKNK